jgi:general secretion pathway protein G
MRRENQKGMTMIELVVACTIMLVLTTMAVPLARVRVRLDREHELVWAEREVRAAIDKYKDYSDAGYLGPPKLDTDGYPDKLETLVEGVKLTGQVDKKIRFLRRIPKDPFTNSKDWGMRSTKDDPTSNSWGGQNVFDIYTKSTEAAPDGTKYSDW